MLVMHGTPDAPDAPDALPVMALIRLSFGSDSLKSRSLPHRVYGVLI